MVGHDTILDADMRQSVPAHVGTPATARIRRFLPLAILAVGLVLFFALDLGRFVSLSALRDNSSALSQFVADHSVVASLVYVAVYALATAFSIPGAVIMTIGGGFVFGSAADGGLLGILWASALTIIGATLGAVGIFLAARSAAGETLRRRAGPWVNRLASGFNANAFSYMLTLRLIPIVPFWLVNLVPAVLGVPLATYALATVIGIVPGTVVYVAVGNGLGALLSFSAIVEVFVPPWVSSLGVIGGPFCIAGLVGTAAEGVSAALTVASTPDLGIILKPALLLPLIGLAVLSLVPVVYKLWRAQRG